LIAIVVPVEVQQSPPQLH